jgi:hypothetical protein
MYVLIRDITATVVLIVLPLLCTITSTTVVVVRLRSIAPSSSTPVLLALSGSHYCTSIYQVLPVLIVQQAWQYQHYHRVLYCIVLLSSTVYRGTSLSSVYSTGNTPANYSEYQYYFCLYLVLNVARSTVQEEQPNGLLYLYLSTPGVPGSSTTSSCKPHATTGSTHNI